MEIKQLNWIYLLLIIFGNLNFIFGTELSQFKNIRNSNRLSPRELEDSDYYDNYISIYFGQDCSYSKGFKNDHRKDISFIINGEINTNLTSEEALAIHKDIKVEIHFNKRIKELCCFFSSYFDDNMKFLKLIDFSHFDSSLVTNMEKAFESCESLESINLSNIDTYKVISMAFLFYE